MARVEAAVLLSASRHHGDWPVMPPGLSSCRVQKRKLKTSIRFCPAAGSPFASCPEVEIVPADAALRRIPL